MSYSYLLKRYYPLNYCWIQFDNTINDFYVYEFYIHGGYLSDFLKNNFIVSMYIQSFEYAKSIQSCPTLLHFKQDYWSGLPSLLQGIFPPRDLILDS